MPMLARVWRTRRSSFADTGTISEATPVRDHVDHGPGRRHAGRRRQHVRILSDHHRNPRPSPPRASVRPRESNTSRVPRPEPVARAKTTPPTSGFSARGWTRRRRHSVSCRSPATYAVIGIRHRREPARRAGRTTACRLRTIAPGHHPGRLCRDSGIRAIAPTARPTAPVSAVQAIPMASQRVPSPTWQDFASVVIEHAVALRRSTTATVSVVAGRTWIRRTTRTASGTAETHDTRLADAGPFGEIADCPPRRTLPVAATTSATRRPRANTASILSMRGTGSIGTTTNPSRSSPRLRGVRISFTRGEKYDDYQQIISPRIATIPPDSARAIAASAHKRRGTITPRNDLPISSGKRRNIIPRASSASRAARLVARN